MSDAPAEEAKGEGRSNGGHKVYLVIVPVPLPLPGRPNRKILAAKPTYALASALASEVPGGYVEKFPVTRGSDNAQDLMRALAK